MQMLGLIALELLKIMQQSMNEKKENILLKISIHFRPTKSRAIRRFIPMMWIDQVQENSFV